METLSLKSQHKDPSVLNKVALNDDVVRSIMHVYLHEVLPIIDKLFNAVAYNDHKLLPSLSQKLRPFFTTLGISTEPLEKMEHPEELNNDFKSLQKLYMKVKSMSETAIDEVKYKLVSIEARDFSKQENKEVDIKDLAI